MADISRAARSWGLVVGVGNAAPEAAEAGAGVIALEGAPKACRGGNSRHTRNFRCMHPGPLSVLTDTSNEEESFDDLMRVMEGKTDEHLACSAFHHSEACLPWLEPRGGRFQPSLSGTLSLGRTNAFFLCGGKALVNAVYNTAEDLGMRIACQARVRHLGIHSRRFAHMHPEVSDIPCRIAGRAVVWPRAAFRATSTGWPSPGGRRRAPSLFAACP